MTRITFYNGLREIGGTFVEVATEQAKCMFDFGFAVAGRMDSKIRLRDRECAADYARLGVLTVADGIYDKKTAQTLGVKAYGETKERCFFVISHMHIDHMGGLGMLAPEIPVYMSSDSLRLYRQLALNKEVEVRPHPCCIGLNEGESAQIGDITVTSIPVDHDVIGACGFKVTTADGTICYTGDYRFHGFHPEVSEGFAQAMKGADLMITEGVTVSNEDVDMLTLEEPKEPQRTEYTLLEEVRAYARESRGLIVINPYNRNVERLHEHLKMLKAEGRILVMDGAQADYVSVFYPEDEIYVYEPTGRGALKRHEADANWHVVTRDELLADPGHYVLQIDYGDFYELMDLQAAVSQFIHMDGAPLGGYDPSFEKMKAFLENLNIPYVYLSLGGHSRPWYLRHMIDTIAPGTLVPLHSFRPEQVQSEKAGQRILPEFGETLILENGKVRRA